MNMRVALLLLITFLISAPLVVAEDGPPAAGETSADTPEGEDATGAETTEEDGETNRPPFSRPPDNRRDVFYDLVATINAEKRIADHIEKQKDTPTGVEEPQVTPGDEREAAELKAKQVVKQIRSLFNERQWDQVLRYIDRNYDHVERDAQRYPDSKMLTDSLKYIKNYRVQAQEKKIYEEARAQFLALELKVEGIIWAADQQSLAIIKGEPQARGVNDRIKNCVIVNIDTNRVDFMFPYRRRKFHFQRYIGEEF